MIYNEVNKFFSRPSSIKPLKTSAHFLNQLEKIAHEPPQVPKPTSNTRRAAKNKTTATKALSSELGAGGVSCLDVSDLSSGHPSPTVDMKNFGGRNNSITEIGPPDNEGGRDNILYDYRQTRAF